MTDTLGDLLTRIRNGYLARKQVITAPHSKLKEAVARLLEVEGYVAEVTVEDTKPARTLKIVLKYVNGQPVVNEIRRLSKPGLRRYASVQKLPRVLGGYGIIVLSTSSGIMSDKQAKAKGFGGELLCSIW